MAFVLSIVIWLISTTSRFSVLRCIPCLNKDPGLANEVIVKVLENIIKLLLTMYLINFLDLKTSDKNPWLFVILFGLLNKLYSDPTRLSLVALL